VSKRERARGGWGRRELQLIDGERKRGRETERERENITKEGAEWKSSREDIEKKDYQMCSNRRREGGREGGRETLYVPRRKGKSPS